MDFTTEYVEMCKAADFIQEVFQERSQEDRITNKDFLVSTPQEENNDVEHFWLPRFDQLFEIHKDILRNDLGKDKENVKISTTIEQILEECKEVIEEYDFCVSVEQAMLCLFMKEFEDKRWDVKNKQWIEI